MSEEKKKDIKRQTKAGMMSESQREAGEQDELEPEKDPDNTPPPGQSVSVPFAFAKILSPSLGH